MGLRRTTVVSLALTLVVSASIVSGCKDDSTATSTIYESQTATGVIYGESTTTSTTEATTTTQEPRGASVVFAAIGQVMEVEQGELSVDKLTVTHDLASDDANALLLTGLPGEETNESTKPAEGNEFLMITFKYKKAVWYDFRGGIFSDDVILKDADGKIYDMVETKGYGGIAQSNAGQVEPGVEAYTTAVYEVPEGETGLVLIYHEKGQDGFTCELPDS
jgi:hypothetical protein